MANKSSKTVSTKKMISLLLSTPSPRKHVYTFTQTCMKQGPQKYLKLLFKGAKKCYVTLQSHSYFNCLCRNNDEKWTNHKEKKPSTLLESKVIDYIFRVFPFLWDFFQVKNGGKACENYIVRDIWGRINLTFNF